MAKLTDLPDEILIIILKHFELYHHSPYLLRSAEADDDAVAGRAQLARTARTCKRLRRLAEDLSHFNQWISVDLKPIYPYRALDVLAEITACKNLQYLICDLAPEAVGGLLTCLNNVAPLAALRSLSLTIQHDEGDGDSIDLSPLSELPNLVGLEFYMCDNSYNWNWLDTASHGLPSLKDLQCGTNTFHQLVSLLSLPSSRSLEILGIYWDINWETVDSDEAWRELWKTSWQDRPMRKVRQLSILCGAGGGCELPAELLAEIPRYLPALETFDLNYEHGLSSERYPTIIKDHHMVTSITISPDTADDLKVLLQAVKEDLQIQSRLRFIRIGMQRFPIDIRQGYPELEIAQLLWREAHTAACASGVALCPPTLIEAIYGIPEEAIESESEINRDEGNE